MQAGQLFRRFLMSLMTLMRLMRTAGKNGPSREDSHKMSDGPAFEPILATLASLASLASVVWRDSGDGLRRRMAEADIRMITRP